MEPNNQTTIVQTKSSGALVGSIIIIIILIIGGIYFWQKGVKGKVMPPNSDVSTFNESSNLDANVNSIDVDSLDSGI